MLISTKRKAFKSFAKGMKKLTKISANTSAIVLRKKNVGCKTSLSRGLKKNFDRSIKLSRNTGFIMTTNINLKIKECLKIYPSKVSLLFWCIFSTFNFLLKFKIILMQNLTHHTYLIAWWQNEMMQKNGRERMPKLFSKTLFISFKDVWTKEYCEVDSKSCDEIFTGRITPLSLKLGEFSAKLLDL